MFGRYSIFKWQFWRWRYRYWRRRAVKAERALEAESQRNRSREDEFATFPMRLAGSFAPPPRTGPAESIRQIKQQPLLQATNGVDSWTWADSQEFEMFWKPPEGSDTTTVRQMKERFHNEVVIPRRQPFNDDNFN